MTVTVLWFGPLRERRGCSSEEVEVLPGESLAAIYARLVPPPRVPVAWARNAAYTTADDVPEDGDEIAFLPPLGGG